MLQIICIWYSALFSLNYLTSTTGAYFNDVKVIENYIQAWVEEPEPANWDKSSLKFQNNDRFDCSNGFQSVLKNKGRDMEGPSTFVLYYQESGSPTSKNPGIEIKSGKIPAIKSGESYTLSFLPEVKLKNGTYKFMAYQRPKHPGRGQLWAGEIIVTDKQINACNWNSNSLSQNFEEEIITTNENDNFQTTDESKNEQKPIDNTNDDNDSNFDSNNPSSNEDTKDSNQSENEKKGKDSSIKPIKQY
jgi:YqxM protein